MKKPPDQLKLEGTCSFSSEYLDAFVRYKGDKRDSFLPYSTFRLAYNMEAEKSFGGR